MGLRLRLKASVDISGYPQPAQVVLRVVKKYDMLLADNCFNWYITGAAAQCWNDDELHAIGAIKGRGFEVVQPGELSER